MYTGLVYFLLFFYYISIYIFLYMIFFFYWSLKFFFFLILKKQTELKPKKLNINGNYTVQYFFTKIILQPYLYSFLTLYLILKKICEKSEYIVIDVKLLITFLRNLLVRIITGISINILKKADFITTKAFNIKKYPHKNYRELLFFNLVVDELGKTNKIENLKIYKTEQTWKNFNPDKDKIIKLFNIIFPKIRLRFPETAQERKIGEIIYKGVEEIKKDSVTVFVSTGGKVDHYGSFYNIGEPAVGVDTLGTNFTSKPTTLGLKNIPLSEKSYLVDPYISESKNMLLDIDKSIKNLNDTRIKADTLNIQDLLILSSLGVKEPNFLYFDYKTKEIKIREVDTEKNKYSFACLEQKVKFYGGKPNNSAIYDLDIELQKAHSELSNVTLSTQENVFKLAIATLLSDPVYLDKLETLATKLS